MSDSLESKSPTPSVVEINSDEDPDYVLPVSNTERLHTGVIEVLSDVSGDESEEVVIVGESTPVPATNDVVITGLQPTTNPRELGPTPQQAMRIRDNQSAIVRNIRRRRNHTHFQDHEPFYSEEDSLFLPELLLQHQRALRRIFHQRDGEVSASIMERINREDELDMDRKMERESIHNRKTFEQKQKVSSSEIAGYSNDISLESNILCELCGIVLGEGIPSDFSPNPEFDDSLVEHASRNHVNAPWFCIRQCFDADRELSKRVFFAKCGHVFCGRCIKNIGNRPVRRGKTKEKMTILNPQISAPRKCPAKDCGIVFNKGKRTFTELFL